MPLNKNQIKTIEKWNPLINIVSEYHKEQWVSNGNILYRLSGDDSIDAVPTQTYNVDPQKFEAIMGTVDHNDTVEASGFFFDAKLASGDKTVSLMIHTSNGVKSVFLIDHELLKKVKPKKDEHFVVGVQRDKRILYNSTRTVGVVCIKDESMAGLLEKYDETFLALDLMRKFNGKFVVK